MAQRIFDVDNMKRLAKKLGKLLLVIIILWVVAIAITFGYRKIKSSINLSGVSNGFAILTANDYQKEWEQQSSDITGWTKWDKYKAGLSVVNGSDTDGDGLSDKDEVEIYHSDPLKVSTSGDLYSDFYKVQNNMDINEKYEYKEHKEYPYNECSEVLLEAESPVDFNAVVINQEGLNRLNGDKPLAQYEVYNYSGKVSFDMGNILSKEAIALSEIEVFVSDGREVKKYGYEAKDNVITLKKNFNFKNTYQIYLMKKSLSNSAAIVFGGTSKITSTSAEDVTGAGFIMDFPVMTALFGMPIDVYYEELSTEEKTELLKSKIISQVKDYLGDSDSYFSEDSIHKSNKVEIGVRYEMFRNFVPFFDVTEVDEDDLSWIHLLFLYYSYEDKIAFGNRPDTNSTSGFNYLEDELPFGNFFTEQGKTGNCAGISHLTAYLYNNKTFPQTGKYADGSVSLSWDISKDSENATLMNSGLADYKTEEFVMEHSGGNKYLTEGLSSGEQEFVKMISALYLEGNGNANYIYSELYGGANGNVIYDYSLIEAMKKQLESGKILDVYLMMVDGSGHAVNIYGYKEDAYDKNVIWFDVYDSNFPQNNVGQLKQADTGIRMRVEKKRKIDGTGYTFSYDYFPLADKGYGATSNKAVSKNSFIIVMDENWRPLND